MEAQGGMRKNGERKTGELEAQKDVGLFGSRREGTNGVVPFLDLRCLVGGSLFRRLFVTVCMG